MKKKSKEKVLVADKRLFFDLLQKAMKPLSKEEAQKEESRKSDESTSKQTRQRKEGDACD